ncbi:MAG: hypothetical protein KGI71_04835 [Patescibacteria group bacterium]|nr:hypothetical protein [Patescibacteria group bacterium]
MITLPSGRRVRLGGFRRPPAQGPHFRLKNYLLSALPDEPPSIDYTIGSSVSAALADVEGNDALGDCVIAWLVHQEALWTGNATGTAWHATLAQVTDLYSKIAGYVPGNPATDVGTDPAAACNWIVANGFPNGNRPLGWVRVEGSNTKLLRQALWLFEGCGFGIGLPQAYVDAMGSMKSGFTWGAAGPAIAGNGHMFLGAGYNTTGVTIDTWGMLGTFTYEAIAQYAVASNGGEIDILLSADMIASAAQKAPSGFDWRSLVSDFDELGGSVAVPPAPPPPVPVGPPTLSLAQQWAAAGIQSAPAALFDAQQAIAAANAGLAKYWPAS